MTQTWRGHGPLGHLVLLVAPYPPEPVRRPCAVRGGRCPCRAEDRSPQSLLQCRSTRRGPSFAIHCLSGAESQDSCKARVALIAYCPQNHVYATGNLPANNLCRKIEAAKVRLVSPHGGGPPRLGTVSHGLGWPSTARDGTVSHGSGGPRCDTWNMNHLQLMQLKIRVVIADKGGQRR